ncbi:MAG: HPr(Ser) kinase/phosphatase [bacterium]|jgi:HPr kinase/phosphorylase
MPMNEEKIFIPDPLPVKTLLKFPDLALRVIAAEDGLSRNIRRAELNRPALELAGFFDKWQPERVQILGTGEMAYLHKHANEPEVYSNIEMIFASQPPCVVITNDNEATDVIIQFAEKYHVSVLGSPHHTTHFSKSLWDHLEVELSPYVVWRGVLMDIFDIGVIITGTSAIGKSESALELLSKGHTFVADDLILIRGTRLSKLTGTGKAPIPYHMEIRGIGIIDISRMYGPRSVRESKDVDMVVSLEEWNHEKEYERLGIEGQSTRILGYEIPKYIIPVRPARNIATIVEVAVLDHKLKESGIEMAKEFDEKLIEAMRKREGR